MAKYRLSPGALWDIRFTCPTANIFPRLRVITAGTSELEPLLMSNSVKVLFLMFNYHMSYTDFLSARRFRSVIDNIRGHMPDLRILKIACDKPIPNLDDELLSLLESASEIKHLQLSPQCFNASIAQTLSCFKYLRTVTMDTDDPIGPWPCTIPSLCSADKRLGPNAFPSLHRLEFSPCNIEDAWGFLSQPDFPFRNLKILFIHTTTIPGPAHVQALLEGFNSICTALTTLTLSFHEFEYRDGNNLLLTPRLNMQHLMPFVHSRTLTYFAFSHPYPIEMTDHDASEIATHCQRFKSLLLNPHPVVTTPTSLTLKALKIFITRCPHLRELGLYLDASVYIPPAVPLHANVPHPLPIDLNLGRSRLPIAPISPLMVYCSIAEFCASILSPSCVWVWPEDDGFYPELKNAGLWLAGLGGHNDLMEYENGWKIVASMTEAILQERGPMSGDDKWMSLSLWP